MGMFYRTKNGSTMNNNMTKMNEKLTSSPLSSLSSSYRARPPSRGAIAPTAVAATNTAKKRQRWMIHGNILVVVVVLVGLNSVMVLLVHSSLSFYSSSSVPTYPRQSRSLPEVMPQQEQQQTPKQQTPKQQPRRAKTSHDQAFTPTTKQHEQEQQSSKQQARQTETNHDKAFTTKTTTTTTFTTTLSSSSSSSTSTKRRTISLSPSILFNHTLIRQFVQDYGISAWHKPIVAYLEAPMHDVVPGTGSRGTLDDPKASGGTRDPGTPPELITPLPLRTQSPQQLERVMYHGIHSCRDVPAKWPVDAGLQLDPQTGEAIVTNVRGDQEQQQEQDASETTIWYRKTLPYCPVDMDPFLPWIHDIFPSTDGRVIHVIAQNKRRCHTGRHESEQVNRLTPQVALMQPVSVQRISSETAQRLAPELWNPSSSLSSSSSDHTTTTTTTTIPLSRYRLAPRTEIPTVDDGHNYTRFICRFTTRHPSHLNHTVIVGETLSTYEFNYEYASYRKGEKALLTPKGKDSQLFWTSNIRFTCPVPVWSNYNLPRRIARGEMVLQDDDNDNNNHDNNLSLPLLYLDLVPIRTSVRYQQHYLGEELIGPNTQRSHVPGLDPQKAWGLHGHVLPDVQASGRWTNLPICAPPKLVTDQYPHGTFWTPDDEDEDRNEDLDYDKLKGTIAESAQDNVVKQRQRQVRPRNQQQEQQRQLAVLPKTTTSGAKNKTKKPHFLSACLWASAEFKTRGTKDGPVTDTAQRLVEWLEFHLLVGFDHFYIYDNSGAHSNTTSLRPVLEPAFAGKVTYVDWPSQICNNNVPAADSVGERSSQYAAESSCCTRFAPFTEWIVSFDTDEYLVPMGNHTSLKTVLQEAHPQEPPQQEQHINNKNNVTKKKTNILSFRSSRGYLRHDKSYRVKRGRERLPNATFLEAYNCDSAGSPKPVWAERARKQVYLADYVLSHFVHYSTVTMGYMQDTYQHPAAGGHYHPHFRERAPTERTVNELTEAVMVHTKTIKFSQTKLYETHCMYNWTKKGKRCYIAFPWPENGNNSSSKDGVVKRSNATAGTKTEFSSSGRYIRSSNGYGIQLLHQPTVGNVLDTQIATSLARSPSKRLPAFGTLL